MRRFKESVFAQFLSFLALAMFIAPINAAGIAHAAEMKPTTKVTHKPIKYFVPGKRIALETTVKDSKGVSVVRCYFKAKGEADYVFVAMTESSGGAYQGVLPAPGKNTEALEYLFLAVNGEKQIVKTQAYTVAKKDDDKVPAWQFSGEGNLTVSTELAKAPAELAGFTDSIVMDVVESTARFGAVAGLYALSQGSGSSGGGGGAAPPVAAGGGGGGGGGAAGAGKAGAGAGATGAGKAGAAAATPGAVSKGAASAGTSGAATAATGATMAGTVTAGAGLSTAAIIGAGALVAGGAAAAAGGGGGGGGGSTSVVTPCNATATSGGDVPEVHTINLGKASGTFQFYYDTQSQQDRLVVTYEGKTLYDTGCVGTSKTVPVSYSGTATSITVTITPNCAGGSGTFWEFSVSCP
jgi:hypothetical protein